MSILKLARKTTPKAPIITIAGAPGVGKNTIAALFPKPIIVSAEAGDSVYETWKEELKPAMLPTMESPVRVVNRETNEATIKNKVIPYLEGVFSELYEGEHEYKTLIIDTVTSINRFLEEELLLSEPGKTMATVAGGWGGGEKEVARAHAKIINMAQKLQDKGIATVFLGHIALERRKNLPDENAEYFVYALDCGRHAPHQYVANSDIFAYMIQEEIVVGGGADASGKVTKLGRATKNAERILLTQNHAKTGYLYGKNRYGMPAVISVPHGKNPLLEYIPFYKEVRNEG